MKEEVEQVYSKRPHAELGGVFMIELDRGHVGTKPWSVQTVQSMNTITEFSRTSTAKLSR